MFSLVLMICRKLQGPLLKTLIKLLHYEAIWRSMLAHLATVTFLCKHSLYNLWLPLSHSVKTYFYHFPMRSYGCGSFRSTNILRSLDLSWNNLGMVLPWQHFYMKREHTERSLFCAMYISGSWSKVTKIYGTPKS